MYRKVAICCLFLTTSCSIFRSALPPPKEEFRGVWVATVANIDWPKNAGDSWPRQQKDFDALLDFYQSMNFNAIILQIRAAGDAFYPSDKAPWSRYLGGKEGIPPDTDQDPLKWLIAETHRRGMQFHAWFNPYRATMSRDTTLLSDTHDYFRHPEWMVAYGNRYYYNPGIPEVREQLKSVIKEVLTRYEVDGIHFDDYFYPYTISGEAFDDSLQYHKLARPGQSLDHWRRSNVDSQVHDIHTLIRDTKPWVQFGISPFGVWRNKDRDPAGSDTRAGQTTYDNLNADPLLWMRKGWIDYLVPQLYWSMDFPAASHRKLVAWWTANSHGTHLYVGNAAYKLRNNTDKAWTRRQELPRQLKLARKTKKVQGNVFFSAKSLPMQPDIAILLRKCFYRYPALPPAQTTIRRNLPEPPHLLNLQDEMGWYRIVLEDSLPPSWQFALVYRANKLRQLHPGNPKQLISKQYIAHSSSFTLGKGILKHKNALALIFLDNYGRESEPIILHLDQTNPYDPAR